MYPEKLYLAARPRWVWHRVCIEDRRIRGDDLARLPRDAECALCADPTAANFRERFFRRRVLTVDIG